MLRVFSADYLMRTKKKFFFPIFSVAEVLRFVTIFLPPAIDVVLAYGVFLVPWNRENSSVGCSLSPVVVPLLVRLFSSSWCHHFLSLLRVSFLVFLFIFSTTSLLDTNDDRFCRLSALETNSMAKKWNWLNECSRSTSSLGIIDHQPTDFLHIQRRTTIVGKNSTNLHKSRLHQKEVPQKYL